MMFERMKHCGIIPVVSINELEKAVPLAKALYAGGLDVIEVTFRTKNAGDAIKTISAECPEMLVGAGTVVTAQNFFDAIKNGAKFIVSPGLNKRTVQMAQSTRIPILPGILTPTEIEAGLDMGLNVFKLFPSESYGGLKTIAALSAPYGNISFVPTGGINEKNADAYLRNQHVMAVGGSWITPKELVDDGNYTAITELARRAATIAQEARRSNLN